jgi:hypothetical protein
VEYLLLACVTLLIGCCVVALVLEPPARIGERTPTDVRKGPGARRSGPPGRSRHEKADAVPSAGPANPGSDCVPSALSARCEALPTDRSVGVVRDNPPPYSPQELRNLLDRRAPASPRAS